MAAYYNEFDPYAAQWLRNLIDAGHIAPGVVDERSIVDVRPDDLDGFTQCHFFAGIGVWSYALRLAGWPDDRPVWTGSCPCQPFSAAGKRGGFDDTRHLWPEFYRLIAAQRPPVVFGEQVASNDGLAWLDAVQADLEGANYTSAAADICAAGVGAPHIRQRLYWVADAVRFGQSGQGKLGRPGNSTTETDRQEHRIVDAGGNIGLADASQSRCETAWLSGRVQSQYHTSGSDGTLYGFHRNKQSSQESADSSFWPHPTNGFWRDADWLFCRDGKWRPVEPGTFPLVNGSPARVGRLRAYGNAIVPQVAETFVRAYLAWLV
jgi:DNA (cytosine-5)-methyltransferase 1